VHKEYHLGVASVNQSEAEQVCRDLDASLAALDSTDVEFLTAMIDSNDTAVDDGCAYVATKTDPQSSATEVNLLLIAAPICGSPALEIAFS